MWIKGPLIIHGTRLSAFQFTDSAFRRRVCHFRQWTGSSLGTEEHWARLILEAMIALAKFNTAGPFARSRGAHPRPVAWIGRACKTDYRAGSMKVEASTALVEALRIGSRPQWIGHAVHRKRNGVCERGKNLYASRSAAKPPRPLAGHAGPDLQQHGLSQEAADCHEVATAR